MPHVIYLGGDSYPGDAHCEEQVITELTKRLGLSFTRQSELMPDDPQDQKDWLALQIRYQQIEKKLAELSDKETIILIGRSSGCRVATSFAYAHAKRSIQPITRPTLSNIAAIVCFAYPFRPPQQKIEPSRFAHLADITIPTLIIQGTRDEYGAADVTDNYALSPSVELLLVEGDHGVNLSEEDWDKVFKHITLFLAKAVHQHNTKRAEMQARYQQHVFNRSVYYFADIASRQAKDHYAHFQSKVDKRCELTPSNVLVTPLQWSPNQTFWEINTQSQQADKTFILTHTNYQFFEWPEDPDLFDREPASTRLLPIVRQVTHAITTKLKANIFKRTNNKPTTKEEQQLKNFITRILTSQEPALENRLELQATELISRIQSDADEEIMLIGQGAGAILAARCLIQAYQTYPALFVQKTKVNLLTFNLQSLLGEPTPELENLKQTLHELRQVKGLQFIDLDSGPHNESTDWMRLGNKATQETSQDYDYLDLTTGSKKFNEIFSLNVLPDIPEDFDPEIYLKLNPDIAQQQQDPVWHWQHHGEKEKRIYHMNLPFGFDAHTYLLLNPDVVTSDLSPAMHYIIHGEKEKRRFL